MKIFIAGGAGLVGQNLVGELIHRGYQDIVVIDKHAVNLQIFSRRFPEIKTLNEDLCVPGQWVKELHESDQVITLQAQIGGNDLEEFKKNNIQAMESIISQMKENSSKRLIHISSSVKNSRVRDEYSITKTQQENIVKDSPLSWVVLRPTLMFGWFDRKHLGWLARFLKLSPVFPVPGDGSFIRQPLYVRDFCRVIVKIIENKNITGSFDISGVEKITYLELIKRIRAITKARSLILCLPYSLFHFLLNLWGKFDANPPFTTKQLKALVEDEIFPGEDWPQIFQVRHTPLDMALIECFDHPVNSNIKLEF